MNVHDRCWYLKEHTDRMEFNIRRHIEKLEETGNGWSGASLPMQDLNNAARNLRLAVTTLEGLRIKIERLRDKMMEAA